jgi:hypothetical protein
LNNQLKVCNYVLELNYVYEIQNNTEINTLYNNIIDDPLLLCLMTDKKCVSSINIEYFEGSIYIHSKTNNQYERKKLNTFLRAVVIIIAQLLYNNATVIFSYAVNPVSYYIMLKYFNAVAYDNDGKILEDDVNIKEYIENNGHILSAVNLNDESKNLAQTVINDTINEFKCVPKGGKNKTIRKKNRKNKSRKNRRKNTVN